MVVKCSTTVYVHSAVVVLVEKDMGYLESAVIRHQSDSLPFSIGPRGERKKEKRLLTVSLFLKKEGKK